MDSAPHSAEYAQTLIDALESPDYATEIKAANELSALCRAHPEAVLDHSETIVQHLKERQPEDMTLQDLKNHAPADSRIQNLTEEDDGDEITRIQRIYSNDIKCLLMSCPANLVEAYPERTADLLSKIQPLLTDDNANVAGSGCMAMYEYAQHDVSIVKPYLSDIVEATQKHTTLDGPVDVPSGTTVQSYAALTFGTIASSHPDWLMPFRDEIVTAAELAQFDDALIRVFETVEEVK
jgi:hypothetical protein